jgi:nucleoside-diphosphate-sugar epimerase
MSELVAFMVRPVKRYTPKMSRFAVIYTCTDFTFSSQKAEKDFGFSPKYNAKEAIGKTILYYRKERVKTF